MQVLELDKLPAFARQELVDFYQFLLQKYQPLPKTIQQKTVILAPRLVKPFQPLKRESVYER